MNPGTVEACCAILYGDPVIELVLGDSLHPGGLAATDALLDGAGLVAPARLLDLGCGTGSSAWLGAARRGLTVTGLDTSAGALERARARAARADSRQPSPTFVLGSAGDLPFPAGSFDAVLAECVVSTTDKPRVLAEIHRVLAPGGRLLLSDMTSSAEVFAGEEPIHPLLSAALCLDGAWRPGELERSLSAAGFTIEGRSDETSALGALLERAAARVSLLRSVSRDLGLQLGRRLSESGLGAATFDDAIEALAWARRAAEAGRIGYSSLLASRA